MTNPPLEAEQGVAELYGRACPRLIGLLSAMSGDRSTAEEIAQEAYLRALERWGDVGQYDDPEAWVRLVAIRMLWSRQRHASAGIRALRRLVAQSSEMTSEPSPDTVAVRQALARIPVDQRIVTVMHYLLDKSVAEISKDLNLPAGTVKSRLNRARAKLSPLLNPESEDSCHAR